jgi:antitoxin ParD1/3/4
MSNVEKISIALPSDMVAVLKAAVESGEYSSASEVVRDALRAWKLKRKMEGIELDELRRLVQEGSESGPGIDGQELLKKLRAKYTTISDKVGD